MFPDTQSNTDLVIAAKKYALEMGADVLIPPGDFRDFSFVVDHFDSFVNQPFSEEKKALLQQNFLASIAYPVFLNYWNKFFVM